MRKLLGTTLLCCLTLNAVTAHAQNSKQPDVIISDEIAAPGAVSAVSTNAAAYEGQRRKLRATPVNTIGELRDSYETLSGRYIEIRGEIKGVIESSRSKTCVLIFDQSMVTLSIPDKLAGSPALTPGILARLIVTGDDAATAGRPPLTIVAAVNGRTAAPAAVEPVAAPVTVQNDPTAPIIVPPMTSMTLPPANRTQFGDTPTVITPMPVTPRGGRTTTATPAAPRAVAPAANPATFESQKPFFKTLIRRSNRRLTEAQIEEIAAALLRGGYENNMDPRFLASIISIESDFDINCKSSSGAMGLGQLMPFNVPEAGISDPWNPTQNVIGTARLLRGHLNDYANMPNGTLLAVAAYNAGPGAVRRAGYQVPNGTQVQRYVWKVYYRYKELAPDMFPQ